MQARNVALHESVRDHDRIRATSAASTKSDGVIDDGRDLSIETRIPRQGGSVSRAVGVSLPRRAGPLSRFSSSLRQIISDLSSREFSQSRFYFKLSSCSRELIRILLESTKFLPVAKNPVANPSVLFFKSAKFNSFLRRVGRELDKQGRSWKR